MGEIIRLKPTDYNQELIHDHVPVKTMDFNLAPHSQNFQKKKKEVNMHLKTMCAARRPNCRKQISFQKNSLFITCEHCGYLIEAL